MPTPLSDSFPYISLSVSPKRLRVLAVLHTAQLGPPRLYDECFCVCLSRSNTTTNLEQVFDRSGRLWDCTVFSITFVVYSSKSWASIPYQHNLHYAPLVPDNSNDNTMINSSRVPPMHSFSRAKVSQSQLCFRKLNHLSYSVKCISEVRCICLKTPFVFSTMQEKFAPSVWRTHGTT
ncbi:hypothetical protein BHM03_00011527 [Ensete ventricosum]|nr:hypothetical protein BHM03_00011527 [Ensete ventricosum]